VNALEIERLSYRYPDGTEALCEVSLTLGEGERLALIGPNGAGKSTLLLHLNGLLPERASSVSPIRVFGTALAASRLAEIRAWVGLLFQDPDDQLFCPTVFEDVAFGPQQWGIAGAELKDRVEGALRQAGLAGYGERLPHHLSRGEKRRVCLAGLLACDARLLALDEPTSDLDPRGRRELKALLKGLPVAQIIATHDLELVAEICSRVVLLDRGAVVASGPALDLLDDEALMIAHGLERPHILRHLHPH